MEQLFQVRYNVMNVDTITGYANVKGVLNNGCKDVCLVAMLGVTATYTNDVSEVDKGLGMHMLNGNVYYKRINALNGVMSQNDILFYTNCYEQWNANGKLELRTRAGACGSADYRKVLSEICKMGQSMYLKMSPNASDSMMKNFIVKVLFWMDQVFGDEDFRWEPNQCYKLVTGNVEKKQEMLFWYMVSKMGIDVMLLQTTNDIDSGLFENNVRKVTIGDWGKVELPQYCRPTVVRRIQQAVNSSGACNTSGSSQGSSNAVNRPVDTTGNIKVTIPEHHRRQSASRVGTVGSVRQTTERRERSYEELAQLASSVVLIAKHGANGEVIGTGSGIMIGSQGYILTNNHVACGGRYYSIKIEDDDKVYATDEVIKYNSVLDLAVIRIQRQLKAIPVYKGETGLVRGQRVVAIGSPLGLFNSVSDGIISGFRTIDTVDMIQFTAPISHGSSGGAVLNMYGEVIGISTAGMDEGQNINLAVGYESINTFIKGFT